MERLAAAQAELIVRGARQVGKTWAVTDFGTTQFGALHTVDLERHREWHRLFAGDLDARQIVAELKVVLGQRINVGADLLFFDEIQACPRALVALRYFHEQMPELHVVAAGSLLEFALGEYAFPVGRVQFATVFPMSFVEFLWAIGDDVAAEVVSGPPRAQPGVVHDHLLERLRPYLFVGGMPEAVASYASTSSLQEAFAVHDELAVAYREDFGKYAGRADKDCLDAVLASVARGVGSQVKYARLAIGFDNRAIKQAFDLLSRAQVVHPVRMTSPSGVPLAANASQTRFKAVMVDLGLLCRLCGLRADVEYARPSVLAAFGGALAEQFVGQELLAAVRVSASCTTGRAQSGAAPRRLTTSSMVRPEWYPSRSRPVPPVGYVVCTCCWIGILVRLQASSSRRPGSLCSPSRSLCSCRCTSLRASLAESWTTLSRPSPRERDELAPHAALIVRVLRVLLIMRGLFLCPSSVKGTETLDSLRRRLRVGTA